MTNTVHKKIKTEHHILKSFHKILIQIANFSSVKKIIPGRISRKQKGSSHIKMTLSYSTLTGRKYIIKKGATAQEIFIVCHTTEHTLCKQQIQKLLDQQKLT